MPSVPDQQQELTLLLDECLEIAQRIHASAHRLAPDQAKEFERTKFERTNLRLVEIDKKVREPDDA
jgi:hypothetical protein